MFCRRPKVIGGSGHQNECGGEIRTIQTSRVGSRELHTDFFCTRCHHKWKAEELATELMQALIPILGLICDGNSKQVVSAGDELLRLLRERALPQGSKSLSAELDANDRVH